MEWLAFVFGAGHVAQSKWAPDHRFDHPKQILLDHTHDSLCIESCVFVCSPPCLSAFLSSSALWTVTACNHRFYIVSRFHSVSSAIVSLCHLCSYLILWPCFALIPLEIDLEGKAKMRSYLNTVTPIVWSQLNSYKRWDHLPCSKSKIRLNLKTKSL